MVNQRQHPCHYPGCDKVFSRVSHLNDHLNIHNRKKPYQCNSCSFRCANLSNIHRHHLLMHFAKIKKSHGETQSVTSYSKCSRMSFDECYENETDNIDEMAPSNNESLSMLDDDKNTTNNVFNIDEDDGTSTQSTTAGKRSPLVPYSLKESDSSLLIVSYSDDENQANRNSFTKQKRSDPIAPVKLKDCYNVSESRKLKKVSGPCQDLKFRYQKHPLTIKSVSKPANSRTIIRNKLEKVCKKKDWVMKENRRNSCRVGES